MCKKEICCLEITVAARIVGVLGLVISVTVLSQLISELIRHDGRGKISALLGIDIDEFNINEDNATVIKLNDNNILNNSIIESNSTTTKGMQSPNYFIVICFLFALVQVMTNALLIWSTVVEKRRYAVPWLLCETASFLVQVAGFAYYVTQKKTNELNIGVLVAAIVNIAVTIYFWCVVFRAQKSWKRQHSRGDNQHAVVMTKSTELSSRTDKLRDSTQLPVITVTSEPAQSLKYYV